MSSKAREALLAVYDCVGRKDGCLTIRESAFEKVLEALKEPLRNCDVYDAKTAEKEFIRQTGSKSIRSKSVRWLYAPHNYVDMDNNKE